MADTMQGAWDAAISDCLNGHPDNGCTYGGMTPNGGYWLAAEDCPRNHGDQCAWCPNPATASFTGWADGMTIYAVTACQAHADQWRAAHPEWTSTEPDTERQASSLEALMAEAAAERERILAAMPAFVRETWLEAERAAENMLLHGNHYGPAR